MDIVFRALQRTADGRSRARPALRCGRQQYTYNDVLNASQQLAQQLDKTIRGPAASQASVYGPRVACLANPGVGYVAGQWSTWMRGGIFVPLAVSHPAAELEYTLTDSDSSVVLVERQYLDKVDAIAHKHNKTLHVLEDVVDVDGIAAAGAESHAIDVDELAGERGDYHKDGCFIIYTSGTTGKPKGVLHTHGSVLAQMNALTQAWNWEESDRILHALPLHHIHGIVNALLCAHYNGATVDFMPTFNALSVWRKLQKGETSVFMGVPTMYSHLLTTFKSMRAAEQERCRQAAAALRLTISGSAACPLPIMESWLELSGQTLLERYGMSETGMVLSNPYDGRRVPGTVGRPLPGAAVRVVPQAQEDGQGGSNGAADRGEDQGAGELQVQGPLLFKEYWRRPEATAEAFTEDGFFRTGDTVDTVTIEDGKDPYYRILGRTSVDIIKSGGFKISALRVESALLQHPDLAEVAVLGLPDETLGEKVVLIAAMREGAAQMSTAVLQEWAKPHLPPYEIPKETLFMERIPRNAMGKVNKKALREVYLQDVQVA